MIFLTNWSYRNGGRRLAAEALKKEGNTEGEYDVDSGGDRMIVDHISARLSRLRFFQRSLVMFFFVD